MKKLLFYLLFLSFGTLELVAQQDNYFEKGDYVLSFGSGYRNEYFKLEGGGPDAPNFKPLRLPPFYFKGSVFLTNSFSVSLAAQWWRYQSSGTLGMNNSWTEHYYYPTTHQFGLQAFLDFYWLKRKAIKLYTSIGVDYIALLGTTKYSQNYPSDFINDNRSLGGHDFSNVSPFSYFGGALLGIKIKLGKKFGLEIEGPMTGVTYARAGLTWRLNKEDDYRGFKRVR